VGVSIYFAPFHTIIHNLSAEKNEDVDFEYEDEKIKVFIKDYLLNVDNNSLNINAPTMG
jgi:ribosomal protein L25 (general stress protein Ctc)